MNPEPLPATATPIICPSALTIALPLAPWPLPPRKSTLGGPHLRTFVEQFGADGIAGTAPSKDGNPGNCGIAPSSASKRGLTKELTPILGIKLLKSSGIALLIPFFEE